MYEIVSVKSEYELGTAFDAKVSEKKLRRVKNVLTK